MSKSDLPWRIAPCGEGKLSGDGGAEYPCVRRYRLRRLLTFLWLQGLEATHRSMLSESDVLTMWLPTLSDLVLRGEWQSAEGYLSRFLPRRRPTSSVEAVVLGYILRLFGILADILRGRERDVSKQLQFLDEERSHRGLLRLRSILVDAQQARASIDWKSAKEKLAKIVCDLALATPELKDVVFMPGGPMKPHNVLPIGFGFRQRRRPKKQQPRHPRAPAALAKSYLKEWRSLPMSLPATSHPSQEKYIEGLTMYKALYRMADIFDECLCLKAGKLEVPPLQTTGTEGAITAPPSQTMFGSLAGSVINPVVTSLENAGALVPPVSRNVFVSPRMPLVNAGKSACHALTPGAQISTTVVGCMTSPTKNSEFPLMTNAENGHMGLNLRKTSREETTSSDELDLHLKRQRTTGAFGRHADQVLAFET